MPFYAVANGRQVGVYLQWSECLKQVSGYPNAKFKKFSTKGEAEEYIAENKYSAKSVNEKLYLKEEAKKQENFLPNIGKWKCNLLELNKQISTTIGRLFLLGPENIKQEHVSLISALETSYEKLCDSSKTFNQQAVLLLDEVDPNNSGRIKIKPKVETNPSASIEPNPKKRKLAKADCLDDSGMEDGFVVVYTDGACTKNGMQGAKAGIGAWFGENNPLNISEAVDGRHTNNTAEIQAISEAIKKAKLNGINKLEIRTDSQFVISCMTKWILKWRKNSWKTSTGEDVKNKDDLITLDQNMKNIKIKWTHVKGHSGLRGNEEADRLAREGAKKK